jgi:phage terminase large subunit-like protein
MMTIVIISVYGRFNNTDTLVVLTITPARSMDEGAAAN